MNALRSILHRFRWAFGALLVAAALTAQAQPDIRIGGGATYWHTADTAYMSVDRIENFSVARGLSGSVRLELWALPTPFAGLGQVGYIQTGHLLAHYEVGPLMPGRFFANVYSGAVPYSPPPPGNWYVTLIVADYDGGLFNGSGYLATDFRNFPLENFAPPVTAARSVAGLVPKVGLWWNPAESGTGYGLDFTNGTLVVTMYSYGNDGAPQWFLAVGPLVDGTATASLDRYAHGQCTGCAYGGAPAAAGSAGTMTIRFASPTAATVTLPNGRTTAIQPMF